MGLQDIIQDGEEKVPMNNDFVQEDLTVGDEINNEEDSYESFSDSSVSVDEIVDEIDDFDTEIHDVVSFTSSSENVSCYSAIDNTSTVLFDVVDEMEKHPTTPKKLRNVVVKSRMNLGKKKARRFENARQLDLLGDDVSHTCDITDFMPVDCSFRFTKVLEDSLLAHEFLNPSSDEYYKYEKDEPDSKKKAKPSKSKNSSADIAFNNLYPFEKSFFRKRNLPMGLVEYLDTCLFSFFEEHPCGTYVSEPLSSFNRMILHSIAHYYELNSLSYNAKPRGVRFTKVTNSSNYFNPPSLSLSQYLEKQHYNFYGRKSLQYDKRRS